jgi:hypothetical protein
MDIAAYYQRQHELCGDQDEFYLRAAQEHRKQQRQPVGIIAGLRWWLCL